MFYRVKKKQLNSLTFSNEVSPVLVSVVKLKPGVLLKRTQFIHLQTKPSKSQVTANEPQFSEALTAF